MVMRKTVGSRRLGRVLAFVLYVLGGLVSPVAPQTQQTQPTQYFEAPRTLATGQIRFPRMMTVDDRLVVIYQEMVPDPNETEQGTLYISLQWSEDGRSWTKQDRVIGPVPYAGDSPPYVYSVVTGPNNELYVAVTESAERTVIYRGSLSSRRFNAVHELRTARTNVAPRLSITSTGSVLLFVNQNLEGRQQVVYVYSETGDVWSEPSALEPDPAVGLTFIPSHTAYGGRDYVVYQGLNITARSTYQLYLKTSDDGGKTWSQGRRVTNFINPALSDDPDLFDNQRPHLVGDPWGDQLLLAWERRFSSGNPQLYLLGFDRNGEPNGLVEEVTGRFDLARSPRITFDGTDPVLTWFTNPQGNSRVILGRREGFRWVPQTLSPMIGEATFAEAVSFRGRLHIAWQRRSGEKGAEVVYLEPDQRVAVPGVRGGNFRIGRRSGNPTARFLLEDPADASGIRGYSYTWSRDPAADVPQEIMQRVPERMVTVQADEDGEWYLRVRATDFAGNWSAPATVAFYLDNTPPGPVTFPPPPLDENGFVVSNTFQVGWNPPEDEPDLGGYSTRLDYLGENIGAAPLDGLPQVPQRITSRTPSAGGTNLDDGLWVLTVAAVDAVGNVGPPRSLPLRLNKYVPVTQVYSIDISQDRLGRYAVEIMGRGFSSNGTIRQVVIDRDGEPPYDYEFNAWQNQYSVVGDRRITGLKIDDIKTDKYKIGLLHSERGMYISPETITFTERGTIRYGDFTPVFAPGYRTDSGGVGRTVQDLVYLLVLVGAVILIVVSVGRLVGITREMTSLGREAAILVRGELVVEADERRRQRERAQQMKIHWTGLRIKFMFFIVLLVIGVVLLVAVVLGRNVLERQESILVNGLQERIELLVEGQVTGARPALENPQLNLDQLQNLANQGDVMSEALYVSITALDRQDRLRTIYATTDPAVINAEDDRIDTENYIIGVSRLNDSISSQIEELAAELNARADEALGSIPAEIEQLTRQAQQLILQGAGDDEIGRIDEVRTELLRRGQDRLARIAGPIRSDPAFDFDRLRRDVTTYLFYKPVMAIVPGAGADFRNFYRGTIRVAISTQLIIDEITRTRRDLIITTMIIAAAAVAMGILGAYVLATVVVRPILRLVGLVEEITATEDKASLKGRSLTLRSKDELTQLATSINQMIEGLVQGAETTKDLMFGKETQKAFIPLERINDDTKKTHGSMETGHAVFFGYYEGAKGVSGDYFAYQVLDDRYVAVVKSDVAGKGIPAALIMVQVATMFNDYFRNWTLESPGLDLSSLVLRINDTVAERQFKGRFAALTVGILDTHKGAFYTANAGDVKLHIFRGAIGEVEELDIPGGPAAGTFSSADLPIQFPQEMKQIALGDMLLLFTDGLEEAKRLLRNKDWKTFTVTDEMIQSGSVAEGLHSGEDGEEFSIERVHRIIGAVVRREQYRLARLMNPVDNEELVFDFAASENPVQDVVLAVVAIERIFRMVPDPAAGPDDRVSVDRIVHDFLKKHFLQYKRYFGNPVERRGEDQDNKDQNNDRGISGIESEYLEFSHIYEDEQFDDITMLVVARK